MRRARRSAPLARRSIPLSIAILTGVGCTAPSGPGRQDKVLFGEDTSSAVSIVDLELSEEIPTVLTVSWSRDEYPNGELRFSIDPDPGVYIGPSEDASLEDQLVIVGLAPQTEYAFTAEVLVDGAPVETETGSFETGAVPSTIPDFDLWSDLDEPLEGYVITTLLSQPSAAVILDMQGNPVWWHIDDTEDIVVVTRMRLLDQRPTVLYAAYMMNGQSPNADDVHDLIEVSFDGTRVSRTRAPGIHHDFVELPTGEIGYIGYERRSFQEDGGLNLMGDRLMELGLDGEVTELWNAWTDYPFSTQAPLYNQAVDSGEWSHANALDYDPVEDVYYLGEHTRSSIYKLDRSTGDVTWRFGGTDSSFRFDTDNTPIVEQHQFVVEDDKLLIFDNGGVERLTSRVIEYDIDFDEMIATSGWEYEPDPAVFCYVLGDVQRMPEDRVLATWSTSGEMGLIDEEGNEVWKLSIPVGAIFGFTEWVPTLAAE